MAKKKRKSPRKRRARDGGFTLVETLVAFGVLALSLGVLFNIASDATQRSHQAERLTSASLHAQSLLARVGVDIPLNQGHAKGELAGGLAWSMRIEPYGDEAEQRAWPVRAYQVFVELRWADGARERTFSLASLRLGPKAAAP